jgi:hypothetical protein
MHGIHGANSVLDTLGCTENVIMAMVRPESASTPGLGIGT